MKMLGLTVIADVGTYDIVGLASVVIVIVQVALVILDENFNVRVALLLHQGHSLQTHATNTKLNQS